ncbi:MAG TPA: hypothetical protein VFU80_05920, partial [Sphingomicrobium sp.]|nr:hypothetical protein [Sphingomicrobium sp.]
CFVRAQWAAHLASDEEIERFITGDDPPGVQRLISNLEKGGPFEDGVLSSILSPTQWAVVCDFNHGGGRMIVRHLSPKEIAPNFDGEELLEAIVAANAWALVSACALADLAADKTLGERLLQKSAALAA